MIKRRRLSATARMRIFEASGAQCHICAQPIRVGDKWEIEHRIPLALGGVDDESNMRPAHRTCHATKTKADNAAWSKAKRMRAKHIGADRPRGWQSKWRRKINGETVLRNP